MAKNGAWENTVTPATFSRVITYSVGSMTKTIVRVTVTTHTLGEFAIPILSVGPTTTPGAITTVVFGALGGVTTVVSGPS